MIRRIGKVFLLASVSMLLESCQHEETVSTPGASIEFKQADQKIFHASERLVFNLSDDEGVVSAIVYVDGVVISEATLEVSKNVEHVLEWDTYKVADGVHKIAISVDDKEGNRTMSEYPVTVENILLKFVIKPGVIAVAKSHFVFISDRNGDLIVVRELKEGEIVFERPTDFDDEDFTVTRVYCSKSAISMYSTMGVRARTEYLFPFVPKQPSVSVGTVRVKVTDVPVGSSMSISALNGSGGMAPEQESVIEMESRFYKEKGDFFIALTTSPDKGRYKYFDEVSVGTSINLSYNDLTPYELISFEIPGSTNCFAHAAGYTDEIGFGEYYYMSNLSGAVNKMTMPKAPAIFKSYVGYMTFTIDGVEYSDLYHDKAVPTEVKALVTKLVSHTIEGDQISMVIEGAADYMEVNTFKKGTNLSWTHSITASVALNTTIKLPTVPAEILDVVDVEVPMVTSVSSIRFADHTRYSTYDDFANPIDISVDGTMEPPTAPQFYYDLYKVYKFTPNGRKSTKQIENGADYNKEVMSSFKRNSILYEY